VKFKDLTKNLRVMAPLGNQMHRGVIVEPPEGHRRRNGTICGRSTPPVSTAEPYTEVTHITCEADRVELG
jgi:hypothetical protein